MNFEERLRMGDFARDLNPIELLWADLKQYVRLQRCDTPARLKEAVQNYHRTLMVQKCRKFISSLYRVRPILCF